MKTAQEKAPIKQFIALVVITVLVIIGANVYGSSDTPQSGEATVNSTNNQENDIATISTDKGDITVELFDADAPKTVDNFRQLAKKNYYNGVIFHRVIKEFMIQTGDPTETGTGGESAFGQDFEDEINNHKIEAGTVAMANRGPNTNGSQFFIVTEQPQPHLDGKHTVFGRVTNGMGIVRVIAAADVDENDKPREEIHIKSITLEEK